MNHSTTYVSTSNASARTFVFEGDKCILDQGLYPLFVGQEFNGKYEESLWDSEPRLAESLSPQNQPRDYESGFHYYGARYYWSETLTGWLSVDPLSDDYPYISAYNYCEQNPVKLVDPDGEKIINAFIQHKDISQSVEFYKERIIADPGAKKQYENAIRDLEFKHEQYIKTQEAIDAFRAANADEYNIIDNLTFNGQSVDVLVGADLTRNSGNGGVFGKTEPKFLLDGNGKVVAIGNPSNFSIRVTLYGDAFLGETHGLGTIANEFGDVLFSVLRPDYAREQGLKLQRGEHTYAQDPSANFSYDYEYFICNPQKYKKPDPYDEKY